MEQRAEYVDEDRGLTVKYGAICALDDVTLEVMPKEILSVIGANGAGKSTLLKTITGIIKPVTGTIFLTGQPYKECGLTKSSGLELPLFLREDAFS